MEKLQPLVAITGGTYGKVSSWVERFWVKITYTKAKSVILLFIFSIN